MKLRFILASVLSAVVLNLLWAGDNEWTGLPLPEGGYRGRLFSDPIDPNTIYAVNGGDLVSRIGGIFKSTDRGASWHAVAVSNSTASVSSLAIDPENHTLMYAGTWGRGVYKSTDAGESWDAAGVADSYISSVAMDPQNPSTVYAFARLVGNSPNWGLYKSTDEGKNWTNLGPPSSFAWSIVTLAIDPKNSSVLYAGDGGLSNGGLYKTFDGGATWSLVPAMGNCDMVTVVISQKDPRTQYAGGSCEGDLFIGKVFKSTDAGTTWTDMNSGLPENRQNLSGLVVDSDHPQILYAAFARSGLFRSVDGGASWVAFNNNLPNLEIPALALAHGTPNVVYANTGAGLFRFADTSLIATNVRFEPASVRAGSSFGVVFSGTNLTDETYFDIRFRSPGTSADQVAINWQQGFSATHRVPLDTAPGIWTINGVRAHQAIDDHDGDYLPVAATLMVNPVVVTDVRLDATSVRPGGSLTATFSGTNLTDDTYFDIFFRSPGAAIGQVAVNWQRGKSAGHNIPIDTATGTWTIVGVWAHQLPNDHSSDFSPVSGTFAVFP